MKEHHSIGEERISHKRRRENITQQRKKELHKRNHHTIRKERKPHNRRRENITQQGKRGHNTTGEKRT
jgi:hypothetical protein